MSPDRMLPAMTRRTFLARCASVLAVPSLSRGEPLRADVAGYAACAWTLRDTSPRVFRRAREIGLDGVELDMGSPPGFLLDTAAKRREYVGAAKEEGLRISGLALGCLNRHPLKSDPRAPGWVESAIEAAAALGAPTLLLPFFHAGELKSAAERKAVGDILRRLAPKAEENKVILGLENTLSAKDTLEIIERAGSSAVAVYYDTGNSRYWGHDAPSEIRMLGRRICGMHFKDGVKSYGDARLGEGKVDFPAVARALHAIGYRGWITLECRAPDLIPDMRRALTFARGLLAKNEPRN